MGDLSFLTSVLPHTPALGSEVLTSGPPGQSQGGYFRLSIKGKIKYVSFVCYHDAEYKNLVHVRTEILEWTKVRKKNI